MHALGLLLAIPVTLLPAPWRRRFEEEVVPLPWFAGTVLSGVVQAAAALLLGVALHGVYHDRLVTDAALVTASGTGTRAGLMIVGASVYVSFFFTPGGFLGAYFFFEGLLRGVGAAVSHEAVGTLPLWLAERAVSRARAWRDRRRLGPVVPDEWAVAGDELTIHACRPKPWDRLSTIEHEGRLYALVDREERPEGARRWIYRLRVADDRHLIRRVVRYP